MYREKLKEYMLRELRYFRETDGEGIHPFSIALGHKRKSKEKLIELWNDADAPAFTRFHSAVALAYLGDKSGLPIFRRICAIGGGEDYDEDRGETELLILTNSCQEVSIAGLAICVLGEELPVGFDFSKIINPLFPELGAVR